LDAANDHNTSTYGMAWHTSATFSPGELHDEYYMPPQAAPPLISPEPQRVDPGMASHIANGMHNMSLDGSFSPAAMSQPREPPHLSPFPKLTNPPPNCPPSDDELEARLENARLPVLNSNDPEMQLAWAQDALTYCGVCADEAERLAASKPQQGRPATPRVEHQLKQDAMNIVTFLADQHHPRAEFLRGMWLEWGRFGQREDKKEAFRCYSRAADRGYVRAEYRIGMLYESYNDPAKALRHYHRGVDAGDAASCYRLGMMTLRGQHGQQQDFARGIALIKQSAAGCDENAAQGAYVYGMLLARQLPQIDFPDKLLQYDEQMARENIQKAAFMKFAKAQAKMGSMYELGAMGCEFSPALSIHYNALASKQGEADADMALSKWFLVGADKIFPKNEELAYVYAQRAAQTGLPTAEFAMGYFSEIGMYVPVNLENARDWYQKAEKHGNSDATGRLEGLAKKQVLSRKDHENVAISRIKSQHNSMRGQRPDRFRQKQQPGLDHVEEAPVYGAVQPPRGTTPYPENDGPPRVASLDQRPASVAPYPMEDTPPRMGGGPAGGFFNVQPEPPRPATTIYPGGAGLGPDRPSSAFSFKTSNDLRAQSTVGVPQGARPFPGSGPGMRPQTAQPYDQRHVSAPGGGIHEQQRPYHPNDPRTRPMSGGRVASGPAGMGGVGGGMQPAPLRPAPGPGSLSHTPTAPPPGQHALGFTAPVEDRPPVVDPTWNAEKPSRRSRGNGYGASTPFDGHPRPNPGSAASSASSGTLPSSATSAGSRPGSTNPPGTPALGAPPAGKKPPTPAPGKGPKTFEEMGVPAHNQDKECVSSCMFSMWVEVFLLMSVIRLLCDTLERSMVGMDGTRELPCLSFSSVDPRHSKASERLRCLSSVADIGWVCIAAVFSGGRDCVEPSHR
jgi:TPR repeat protein